MIILGVSSQEMNKQPPSTEIEMLSDKRHTLQHYLSWCKLDANSVLKGYENGELQSCPSINRDHIKLAGEIHHHDPTIVNLTPKHVTLVRNFPLHVPKF